MAHPYSEEQLVEEPAFALFAKMGWRTKCAHEEVFGPNGTLGRQSLGDTVLEPELRRALARLNPDLSQEAISQAAEELRRDRSAMSLVAANREAYRLMKDGVEVVIPNPKTGEQKHARVRVIDWRNPSANDFLAVRQISFTGPLFKCRPDMVGFVNGLPLVLLEFKKVGLPVREAFDGNVTSYLHPENGIPALFAYNAAIIVSNGMESRMGSLTADWERFFEWKRIESEEEPRRISLEVMIQGTCEPTRLLDLIENFTLFSEHKSGLAKIIGQNHQFLGVNSAIAAMLTARQEGHGRGGVFWQTQGSGKSFSMVFFAQKVHRTLPGNWTFVVVTDRVELDGQIAKTFKACGAVTDADGDECHASSGAHLRRLLGENHRYVFTLIHKFQTPEMLCDRRDVIVLSDEAHRSQYDTLAMNMRGALPNALFLAFTGTPLIDGAEQQTREVFGDYVSIYNFQESVEDGATVPLFYENRTPELRLDNPNLNEDIYAVIEDAELSEEAERKLENVLGRQYHLITRDDRLETVAKDIVRHFLDRGFQGKAMVVSIDKATALRMYDKVRAHWLTEGARVEVELAKLNSPKTKERQRTAEELDRIRELQRRRETIQMTDMALIVSPGQNEIEQMKKLGLNIAPHRRRMNDELLDEKFKDTKDPLRLVFLCAMWLTGFDVPSCSTVYLDKPMRNHTLMQTIARANRVFPGKHSGLIVDYANVFVSLEKALAIYGAGASGITPVREKAKLVDALRDAIKAARDFCDKRGVKLAEIQAAPKGSMEPLALLADAVNALISPDPLRKEFLAHEKLVTTLYRAVKPDPAVIEFVATAACLATIADAIRSRLGQCKPDISAVMESINTLLDASIAADGFRIREDGEGERTGLIDLSAIDFQALAKRFAKSNRKNVELEELKAAIRAQLDKLIRLNPTRANYLDKFETLIDSYNAGSRNIEETFAELLEFTRNLNAEAQRHIRENLTPEELTVFDLLTQPGPDLTPEERAEVKKVAKQLLEKLRKLFVLDWRRRRDSRAKVESTIKDTLDEGLPRAYSQALYDEKCAKVTEHVFKNLGGPNGAAAA